MSPITLAITQTFNAKIDDVYKAWTDGRQVEKWFGPEGMTNTVHEYDARVGGKYRVTMTEPGGKKHTVFGEFKRLDAPTNIEMTWEWEPEEGTPPGMADQTLVKVALKDLGGKTEMSFEHTGFANEAAKDNHNKGWTSSFVKFGKLFA